MSNAETQAPRDSPFIPVGTGRGLDLRAVEAFLFHEADLLDRGKFEDWMALFTPDGYYWVPTEPDQKSPLDMVSHFYDDRPLMAARIRRLRHPSNLVYTAQVRTHHHVGNVRIVGADGTDWRVSSYVLMAESRPDEQRMFSGACDYCLRPTDGVLKIAWKKVVLVNCDGKFGALGVPF